MSYIFVDCEATGPAIHKGELTEFGAAHYPSRKTFHGVLIDAPITDQENPVPIVTTKSRRYDAYDVFYKFDQWLKEVCGKARPIFVSDNPAFDWQWINYHFHKELGYNPFGFSARRISDFYAGLMNDFSNTQKWKRLRITTHDHNPVNDALGNLEAFERLLNGER